MNHMRVILVSLCSMEFYESRSVKMLIGFLWNSNAREGERRPKNSLGQCNCDRASL